MCLPNESQSWWASGSGFCHKNKKTGALYTLSLSEELDGE